MMVEKEDRLITVRLRCIGTIAAFAPDADLARYFLAGKAKKGNVSYNPYNKIRSCT